MGTNDISRLDVTGKSSISYTDMAEYQDAEKYTDFWKVENQSENTEGASGGYTSSQCDWSKWHAIYRNCPELASVIDKTAFWTVGRGYEIKENKERWEATIKKIRGWGKESFISIIYSAFRTACICGDSFTEIIRDKAGRIVNLKSLNPGSIKLVANAYGIIEKYEQQDSQTKKIFHSWEPKEILHLCWNRIADELHGIPTAQKLITIIESLMELRATYRILMKRYITPLTFHHVKTDNLAEIAAYKAKVDEAYKKCENIIVPDDTAAKIEVVGVDQYGSLDPINWFNYLERQFVMAEGCPKIIQGEGEDTTEASSKILYLAFQQMIEWKQYWLETELENQLGVKLKFIFPAAIDEGLRSDEMKDGGIQGEKRSEVVPAIKSLRKPNEEKNT